MNISKLVGTVLGIGYIRPGPGTWGSLVALPWGWLLHVIGGLPLLIAGIAVAFGAGWWATARMTAGQADHDPSEIVIDEVVGQWIALLPLSYASWTMDMNIFAISLVRHLEAATGRLGRPARRPVGCDAG